MKEYRIGIYERKNMIPVSCIQEHHMRSSMKYIIMLAFLMMLLLLLEIAAR